MFLHLGFASVVNTKDIIAIFDLDTTTISKITRDYLAKAQTNAVVRTTSDELPKSFVVAKSGDITTVYLSAISSVTLSKRAQDFNKNKINITKL